MRIKLEINPPRYNVCAVDSVTIFKKCDHYQMEVIGTTFHKEVWIGCVLFRKKLVDNKPCQECLDARRADAE